MGRRRKNWGSPNFWGQKQPNRRQNSSENEGRQALIYRSYLPSIRAGGGIRGRADGGESRGQVINWRGRCRQPCCAARIQSRGLAPAGHEGNSKNSPVGGPMCYLISTFKRVRRAGNRLFNQIAIRRLRRSQFAPDLGSAQTCAGPNRGANSWARLRAHEFAQRRRACAPAP